MATKDDLFAMALEQRKKKKEADASRENFTYSETPWTSLNASDCGVDKIVRFVGNFPSVREAPTDAKTISFSKIASDSGKTSIVFGHRKRATRVGSCIVCTIE